MIRQSLIIIKMCRDVQNSRVSSTERHSHNRSIEREISDGLGTVRKIMEALPWLSVNCLNTRSFSFSLSVCIRLYSYFPTTPSASERNLREFREVRNHAQVSVMISMFFFLGCIYKLGFSLFLFFLLILSSYSKTMI